MPSFRYSTNLVIPDTSDVKDPIASQEITYILSALRTLATRIDETTGALSPPVADWPNISPILTNLGDNTYKFYAQCGAAPILFGMFVSFVNSTPTTVKAQPAQANGVVGVASGFCTDPNGVAAGQWGEFIVGPGLNYGISGLTPGNHYFLSPTSPGLITATQPTTAGQIIQVCGRAITDRLLMTGSFTNWLLI
jgi:hypothetical protein